MKQYKSSADLKGLAKVHMFGKYAPAVGARVIETAILMAVTVMVRSILGTGTVGTVLSYVYDFVYFMIMGIFEAGQAYLYLNAACGSRPKAEYVFYCFGNHLEKVLVIRAYMMCLYAAVSIPLIIFLTVYNITNTPVLYIFIGLGAVIAIAGAVLISLIYMPAFYLVHDFPNMTAREILKMCTRIMKGNLGRLFYMEVSFIPLQLLEIPTLGIGALWIETYRSAALAEFFLNLMKPGSNEA